MTKHAGKPTFRRMRAKKKNSPPLISYWAFSGLREGTFFLGGGGMGNFGIFSKRKCWPSLMFWLKNSWPPPLLGDWQKCDPPLTTTWYAPCHRNLRTFFDILLVNAKCLNMNKSRYWICARWNKKMRTISVGSGLKNEYSEKIMCHGIIYMQTPSNLVKLAPAPN